jgi:phosphate:Na+ symporter
MASLIVGGLGLFLLGMWLMTEGLRLAAGDALKRLLARWTSTPLRGLVTGFGLTSVLQSSGIVTVATVGFANAGLLTLAQAIWVVYGANVGSTMTGWLVSIIGFEVDIALYALPLVGVGMGLRLAGHGRGAALGQAVAGFGLLFLGIDTLKDGFEGLAGTVTLPAGDGGALADRLIYVGVGALITTLMQSSSAAMVLAFSAVASGLVTPLAAAAVCVGTNLGTTTTAAIAAWGATPTAQRVATGHVLFNLISAAVAIPVLPEFLRATDALADLVGAAGSPATRLALFNSVLNLLGVLLMGPATPWLVRTLERRFRRGEPARLVFLDRTVLPVPALAIDAATREVGRVRDAAAGAIGRWLAASDDPAPLRAASREVHALSDAIARMLAELAGGGLPPAAVAAVQTLLRTLHHYLAALEDAAAAQAARAGGVVPEWRAFDAALAALVADPAAMSEAADAELRERREAAKAALLARAGTGSVDIEALDHALRGMNAELRMLVHLRKGRDYLAALAAGVPPGIAPEADAA